MKTGNQLKVRADFNGLFGEILCLSHQDTVVDSAGNTVELHEGMFLTAYDEDLDENGNRDDLLASGIVEHAPPSLAYHGSRWVLRIDEHGVCNESDVAPSEDAETAEAFFQHRSEGADKVDFLEMLRSAPDRQPDPGDELP